jgi:hypothetical protein
MHAAPRCRLLAELSMTAACLPDMRHHCLMPPPPGAGLLPCPRRASPDAKWSILAPIPAWPASGCAPLPRAVQDRTCVLCGRGKAHTCTLLPGGSHATASRRPGLCGVACVPKPAPALAIWPEAGRIGPAGPGPQCGFEQPAEIERCPPQQAAGPDCVVCCCVLPMIAGGPVLVLWQGYVSRGD